MAATITKDECTVLNEVLGTRTPSGCFSLARNSMEDPFTTPGSANKFEGRDSEKHRNSWLMPRMARRMTKTNKFHVSNWQELPTVNAAECERLRAMLESKMGAHEAVTMLPKACGRF